MRNAARMLALWLVMSAAAGAISAAPLADKLPEGTLLYVGWGGRSLTFDGSLLGQMLKEPEVAAILGAARKAIVAHADDKDAQAAIDHLWAMGSIAWQHPVAVGLFDLEVAPPPGAAAGGPPMPRPRGVVLIDLGKDRPAFADHLQKLLNLAGERLKITAATAGAVSYQSFDTPVGPCGMGFAGDIFFASVGAKTPEAVVALIAGKAKCLSADARFADAMKDVASEQVQMAYYVDVAAAFALVDKIAAGGAPATAPAEPSEFRRITRALGVDGISAVVGAVNIVDRGMHEKMRVLSDAPHRGLLMLPAGKPLPADALAGVPADADLVLTISLDPAALLAEAKRIATEIEPRAGKEIDEVLGMASKELGLDIEKDLLAHVGDQVTLISAPSLGGFITGTVLTVELKDAAKFGESLAKVEAFFKQVLAGPEGPAGEPRQRPEIRSFQAGEIEARYLALSGMPVPVAPTWAVANGRLYVAAFPQVLLAAVTGTSEGPLADAPAFAALRKRVAASPSALAYVNTPALARRLYGVPAAVWSLLSNLMARQVGPVFGAEMLPALPKLEKYLMPDITAISSDPKGITLESYGSGIGRGVLFGAAPVQAIGAAALLPTLSRARMQARRAMSATHLRGIGMAAAMYVAEYNQHPPDLMSMVERGTLTPAMFISPNSGRKLRLDAEGKPVGPFDYVYLGKGTKPDDMRFPAGMILAYERPEINRFRGTHVLYVDGHVVWVTMERFNSDLKKTQAFLEKRAK